MSTEGTLLNTDYTVGGGEVTVADITVTAKSTLDLYFNAANMLSGDVINIRILVPSTLADTPTAAVNEEFQFTDVENDPMIRSFPNVLEPGQHYQLMFEQTAGTARDFNWRVADVPIN
tara:strand:+ start:3151 stop:3504 length:354 start_codon:yes stop_codon:yes gene_type:complete